MSDNNEPVEKTKERILVDKLLKWMKESEEAVSETEYRKRARKSYDFYSGKQTDPEVIKKLGEDDRPTHTFNNIKAKINMLNGLASDVRQIPRVLPVEEGDEKTAQLLEGAYKHFRTALGISEIEMDCFDHMVKSGRSFQYFYLDKSNPFDHQIKSERVPGKDIFLDPSSVKYDLSDARYIFRDKWLPEEEIKAYWPQARIEGGNAYVSANWFPRGDDSSNWRSTLSEGVHSAPSFYNSLKDRYRVVECWYKELEPFYWFINPLTGEVDKLPEKEWKIYINKLKEGMPVPQEDGSVKILQMDLPPENGKRMMHVVKFAIFIGDQILEQKDMFSDMEMFPFAMYGAYKDENDNTWDSVIQSMIDPQEGANTMMRQMVHLLMTSAKPVLMAEQGAIINEDDFKQNSSRPNFILHLKPGALSNGAIRFTEQPNISPLYIQLLDTFNQNMKDSSGIQDSLLGVPVGSREPGISAQIRERSAIAVLHVLLAAFRDSRVKAAKILVYYIQKYTSDKTMVRIEGEEGMKLLALNQQEGRSIRNTKFDIVIAEELENVTQRLATAKLLVELEQTSPGTIPPTVLLDYMSLPFTAREEVKAHNAAQAESQALEKEKDRELERYKVDAKSNKNNG